MRRLMGISKDRHGTYYAIKKVPKELQEGVARVLDNGKRRQVWLKRSLGTKDLHQANIRAKPVLMDFDRVIGHRAGGPCKCTGQRKGGCICIGALAGHPMEFLLTVLSTNTPPLPQRPSGGLAGSPSGLWDTSFSLEGHR